MEEELGKVYSEVIAVLRLIDDEKKLEKLPMEFIELIRSKADPTYMPELSKEIPLEQQNLREGTFSILAWIASKYWNEEVYEQKEETKSEENETINETEIKNEDNKIEELGEISVHNDIDPECLELTEEKSNLPITFKDLNWFEKIKIKISLIFNKLFKKKRYFQDEVLD